MAKQMQLSAFFNVGEKRCRIRSVESRDEYFKQYDKKRKRHFIETWVIGRPWLTDTETGMICSYCAASPKGNEGTWTSAGCTSYKLDSIVKHEHSKVHRNCAEIHKQKTKEIPEAVKIIQSLNKDIHDRLRVMFRNCHSIIMNNRPLTDYLWLCELDEMKGTEVGQTYRNIMSAKSFIKAISDDEFKKVKMGILNTNYLCIIGDGSTDSSVKEQEMWFARTCIRGIIQMYFLGVQETEKADAIGILNGLKSLVETNLALSPDCFLSKVVSMSCDGASVMVGCRNGVGALLKKIQPSIVVVHCMAHRLELSLKDAAKKHALYDKVVRVLLQGIYLFYHNSSLNRSMLKRSFEALKQKKDKLMIPTRSGGTRWIGHQLAAIEHLLCSYKFIVSHMEQFGTTSERVSSDSKSKAKAYLSRNVIEFLLFLMDIFTPLKRMSLVLQDRNTTLSSLYCVLASTIEVIEKYKTSVGPYQSKMLGTSVFEGVSLSGPVKFSKEVFINSVIGSLETRFQDFRDAENIVRATRIADLRSWPVTWDDLKAWGDKEVGALTSHFSNVLEESGVKVEDVSTEWTLLKKEVQNRHMSNCGEKTSWEVINNELRENLPNILELMDLILSLSPSSAEAERGFSQLKLIKTNLRSKMGNELLNQSMIIKLHSPSISNFNPDDVITVWNTTSLRGRRPLSTPLGKRKTDSQSLSQSESIQETNEVEVENDADDLVIVPDAEPLQTDELVEEDSDTEFESIQEILNSVQIEHELKIN